MRQDEFGNLSEWGDVLERLEQLKCSGQLDDHQTGLARLVRFQGNWRLREAALQSCLEIASASDVLIADTLNTLADEQTPLRLRVLAADSLGHLLPRYSPQAGSPFDVERVTEVMAQVATRVQPPVLADALRQALAAVEGSASGGAQPALSMAASAAGR